MKFTTNTIISFLFILITTSFANASPNNLSIQTPNPQNYSNLQTNNSPTLLQNKALHNIRQQNKHQQYQPPAPFQATPNPPQLKKRSGRATETEILQIKQQYRHVNINNKIPQKNYFTFSAMYAPPSYKVTNFANKLNGKNTFEQSAISAFTIKYSEAFAKSKDISMNEKNLGISGTFGKRIAYDALSEWQFSIFQARFLAPANMKNPQSQAFVVKYPSPITDQTISEAYRNTELLQRNINLHYNLIKEFKSLLQGEKTVPYVLGGIGITSQWHTLRLSNGRLGMAGLTGGRTTKQEYLSIKPSFVLALGVFHHTSQNFAFNFRLSSHQLFTEIVRTNYISQFGITFFY